MLILEGLEVATKVRFYVPLCKGCDHAYTMDTSTISKDWHLYWYHGSVGDTLCALLWHVLSTFHCLVALGVGCESLELIYCTLLQLQGSTMVKIKILHLLCILMFEEVCGT